LILIDEDPGWTFERAQSRESVQPVLNLLPPSDRDTIRLSAARAADGPRKGFNPPSNRSITTF